jgi:plasmid stability protein
VADETHRALKARAVAHGRSTEAEVRAILSEAVSAPDGEGLGSRIARLAAEVGGFELDLPRSTTSREPTDFS